MTPIESTRSTLARTGATKLLVAVSGGKDSLATLDACVRHVGAENVTGFLMELVKGCDVEWRPIRAIERRFKIDVIGVPHWELSGFLKRHMLRPYTPAFAKLRVLKQADIEAELRKRTGIDWVAWGMRAADSIVRNAYLKKIQGVDPKGRRVYPLWTWKKRDVLGYLKLRKIPVPAMVGGGVHVGGVSLTPKCLRWLREHEPADFARVLKVFPFAEAQLIREDLRGESIPQESAAPAREG